MIRRIITFALALALAAALTACGGSTSRKALNTDALKQFVENSKKNGEMSYERTKKAYNGIFPKMKMK